MRPRERRHRSAASIHGVAAVPGDGGRLEYFVPFSVLALTRAKLRRRTMGRCPWCTAGLTAEVPASDCDPLGVSSAGHRASRHCCTIRRARLRGVLPPLAELRSRASISEHRTDPRARRSSSRDRDHRRSQSPQRRASALVLAPRSPLVAPTGARPHGVPERPFLVVPATPKLRFPPFRVISRHP